jgi:KDO2-lipid IV(A) lauroyltransferase
VSKRRSSLRNQLEFAAYRAVRAVAGRLGCRAAARIGAALGDLFFALGARRRRISRFNLRLAYPERDEDERRRMAREVARHFGRASLDVLRIQTMEPRRFLDEVTVSGQEKAVRLLERGQGIIFLAAHIGLWEVCAAADSLLRGQPMQVVNRPLDNPFLEEELARFRRHFGYEPLGKRNMVRAIMSELKRGGSVGFLIDQRVGSDVGVQVPFFGQPAWTHSILARIVRRTRAPVMPICALWDGPGRYSVHYLDPVIPDELAENELEDLPLTTRFNRILEAMIRNRPEQWLWYHDRWRELRLEAQ